MAENVGTKEFSDDGLGVQEIEEGMD